MVQPLIRTGSRAWGTIERANSHRYVVYSKDEIEKFKVLVRYDQFIDSHKRGEKFRSEYSHDLEKRAFGIVLRSSYIESNRTSHHI